mgnify:CR=1 FL=1
MDTIKDIFWTIVLCVGIIATMAIAIMIFEFIISVIPAWLAIIIIALIMMSIIIAAIVIVFMCLRNAVRSWRNR